MSNLITDSYIILKLLLVLIGTVLLVMFPRIGFDENDKWDSFMEEIFITIYSSALIDLVLKLIDFGFKSIFN